MHRFEIVARWDSKEGKWVGGQDHHLGIISTQGSTKELFEANLKEDIETFLRLCKREDEPYIFHIEFL